MLKGTVEMKTRARAHGPQGTGSGDPAAEALVLHSVEQAEAALAGGLLLGRLLCTTHPGVEVHLAEKHGLECPCLSSLFSIAEAHAAHAEATVQVDAVLADLDRTVGPALAPLLGNEAGSFHGCYRYYGKYFHQGMTLTLLALRRFMERSGARRLLAYDTAMAELIPSSLTFADLLVAALPDYEVAVQGPRASAGSGAEEPESLSAAEFIQRLRSGSAQTFPLALESYPLLEDGSRRACILLMEPLYSLSFLREPGVLGCEVVMFRHDALPGFPPAPRVRLDLDGLVRAVRERTLVRRSPVSSFLLAAVLEHFSWQASHFFWQALGVRALGQRRDIRAAVWGNPPLGAAGNLLVGQFLRGGVPVVGMQHGSCYGEINLSWHEDSDYRSCSRYLTFGFDGEDIRRVYGPGVGFPCSFHPVGRPVAPCSEHSDPKASVDILYPLTNAFATYRGGCNRTLPHHLARLQVQLLDGLDRLEGATVHAKPFAYASPANTAVLPILERLRGVAVLRGVTLEEYLQRHNPRCVLIDLYSTPLVEVLRLDTEIILLREHYFEFNPVVLEMLSRRVHYAEDAEHALRLLEDFLQGRLPRKRDSSFAEHYADRPGTIPAITRLIREAAALDL